jgi:acylphosphatase
MKVVRVIVSGFVQGVGYRAFVEANATERDLKGWVCNRRNGTVEAVLAGEDEDVEEMLSLLKVGPRFAQVASVEEIPQEDEGWTNFEILPTV